MKQIRDMSSIARIYQDYGVKEWMIEVCNNNDEETLGFLFEKILELQKKLSNLYPLAMNKIEAVAKKLDEEDIETQESMYYDQYGGEVASLEVIGNKSGFVYSQKRLE